MSFYGFMKGGAAIRRTSKIQIPPGRQPPAHLVIMAKMPVMGRVKTRLARDTGSVTACCFYRHTVRSVIRRLAGDSRWRTVLALSPDQAVNGRGLGVPSRLCIRTGQGGGSLGQRMQRIFDIMPPGPVLIVGTDIPQMRPGHIAAALRVLRAHDGVVGPAGDGGYWLIGLRRSPRILRPFAGVRWSGPHALDDTLANLGACRIGLAARLNDVDDGADLALVRRFAGRVVLPLHSG